MSCETVTIIQGEDREFFVRITDSCSGNNFDLTTLSAAKAIFKGTVSNVEITLAALEIEVITPATNGQLLLTISDTKTALMKRGNAQTFELELTLGSDIRIVQVEKLLNVVARI
jgi:hypothetical protein